MPPASCCMDPPAPPPIYLRTGVYSGFSDPLRKIGCRLIYQEQEALLLPLLVQDRDLNTPLIIQFQAFPPSSDLFVSPYPSSLFIHSLLHSINTLLGIFLLDASFNHYGRKDFFCVDQSYGRYFCRFIYHPYFGIFSLAGCFSSMDSYTNCGSPRGLLTRPPFLLFILFLLFQISSSAVDLQYKRSIREIFSPGVCPFGVGGPSHPIGPLIIQLMPTFSSRACHWPQKHFWSRGTLEAFIGRRKTHLDAPQTQ